MNFSYPFIFHLRIIFEFSVQEEEPANKIAKFSAFSGSAKRLDGKASVESVPEVSSPMLKQHQPKATNGASSSVSSSSSRRHPGKLVFGSNSDQPPIGKPKVCIGRMNAPLATVNSKYFGYCKVVADVPL